MIFVLSSPKNYTRSNFPKNRKKIILQSTIIYLKHELTKFSIQFKEKMLMTIFSISAIFLPQKLSFKHLLSFIFVEKEFLLSLILSFCIFILNKYFRSSNKSFKKKRIRKNNHLQDHLLSSATIFFFLIANISRLKKVYQIAFNLHIIINLKMSSSRVSVKSSEKLPHTREKITIEEIGGQKMPFCRICAQETPPSEKFEKTIFVSPCLCKGTL